MAEVVFLAGFNDLNYAGCAIAAHLFVCKNMFYVPLERLAMMCAVCMGLEDMGARPLHWEGRGEDYVYSYNKERI